MLVGIGLLLLNMLQMEKFRGNDPVQIGPKSIFLILKRTILKTVSWFTRNNSLWDHN